MTLELVFFRHLLPYLPYEKVCTTQRVVTGARSNGDTNRIRLLFIDLTVIGAQYRR